MAGAMALLSAIALHSSHHIMYMGVMHLRDFGYLASVAKLAGVSRHQITFRRNCMPRHHCHCCNVEQREVAHTWEGYPQQLAAQWTSLILARGPRDVSSKARVPMEVHRRP